MKKYIFSGVVTLLLVGVVAIPSAHAETTSNTAMLEQIKVLMAKLEDLQKQLAEIRGEVKSTLKAGLSEGMSDADVAKLQELLATDPTIYPEGKKTGYFGPLTRDAIKRFQARHELEVTGKIDEETHDLLEEYLHEGFGDKIPAGLLKAPGIAKKVQDRFLLGCEKREGREHGMGPLCKKWKGEHEQDDDDSDDDADKKDGAFDVEVEIEDGDTTVTFTFEGEDYEVVVDNSTKLSDVLDAVADEINDGDDSSDLDSKLKTAIAKKFVKAVADASEDEDFDVEVEIKDGDTTVTFTFEGDDYEVVVDNSTKLSDVLDAVADEINDGDDSSDLDEDLADEIEDALDDAEDEE
jgi:hypothetical protein